MTEEHLRTARGPASNLIAILLKPQATARKAFSMQ
jgi:hypothetical protein